MPVDPVGLSLLLCCSSSFVLTSALLPSLSSLVPKVSREVCVCFRLFVCDSQSIEKEFLSAPIHSRPLWSLI
jgi:hypothetical protein